MDPKRRECYAVRVKLSLPAPIVEDKLCTYFQSNEGGNCDVDSVRLMGEDADGSWYKVAFVEQSGVSKVLSRPDHEMVVDGIKIPLEVRGYSAPPPDTSESASSEENLPDKPEEDERLIEVTGLKHSTPIETLNLYFENPHKSGGGEIETFEREPKTGVISITFKDQSVTPIVAGKKHTLSGATLNVKLVTKKKRRPLPINTRCLFLEGIPDGCSSEHVTLFIENKVAVDEEPTIRYGEKPGTAICTFSSDIPDLEDVIRKICRRKLKGASLKAEKVHHCDAILVQGVPKDLEIVELYFDNPKKSGSSGVRDIQPGPMDGQAIVYFEDWKVVQDVLTKGRHKLCGKDLRIEPYHDFLGGLSPLDAPTSHIPKPVPVEVQESIMEFLYGKGENTKKKLLKDLAKVKANLLWPDGSQKSQAKLEPVIDKSQHQSWLNWEKEAVDVLTDFMRGHKTARVPVPQTLWKDAADKLQKMTTACSMVPDTQLHEVILVGEQRDVDVAEATINDIIMELQKKSKNNSSFKAEGDSDTKEEHLPDKPEEDEPEADEQLIVVTGLNHSTDIGVLKLYFENPSKSGGGEIETFERESETGVISITFKDKSEGIPDGCSSEHLKLFIENRASMDEEPTIQYGEKPGTAICTFSSDIPDLENVIRKVSRRKLKDAPLKAEKVPYSDAILVQGGRLDLDMVELYFDNKKKSGGGAVRELQPGPMDGQAIVYFEDWKVVEDVLRRSHHKLGRNELRVEPYHDFLGRLSPFDAPTPHIPKPVSVEVQESIMEFLYGKGANAKKKLLKDLAKVKANLLWPDGSQKSQAKLEPVEDDSQHQSWLNWENAALDVVTDFMSGYKTARVPVPQPLWKGAADKLQKMTTACSMVQDTRLHEVILVGEQKDTDVTEAKINLVTKELQKEADYDAEQTKEDITWDEEKLRLFSLCGIKQEIEKSFPALKITVFSSYGKTGITLDGIRKTIKDAELKIRRMMDTLEKTEVKAGSTKVRFVQRVPDAIHEVLGSLNIHAACSGSDDGKITIYGATARDVRKAKSYIDNEIDEDTLAIKGQSALAVLQGHDGKRLLDSINNQKFVMAGISHEPGAKFIKLAGFKRNLDETKNHIMDYLKKNVIIKSTIHSNKSKIRLITTYHSQELEKVRQRHQQDLVATQAQMSGRNRGFIIQGNEEGLDAVKEKLYPVYKTGMARLFRQKKGKKFLECVEREFHCVITTDCNEESDDKAASTKYHMKTAAPEFVTKRVNSAVYGAEGVVDDKKEEDLQETVILQLSAIDMKSLLKASDKLDTFQAEEFLSEDFPDPMGLLDKMTTEHKAQLKQIGRKRDVTVEPSKGRAKFIRVEGYKFNVKDALLDISQMFTRIQKEETEKQKMEHLAKEVKWKYSTPSGMEDYDEEVNALLEEAYQKKKPNLTLDLEEGKAVIDFQQMQETCNRSVYNVHRVDLKSAARFEPPSNWIPMMKGESTKMVKLTAGSAEYTAVETKFRASVGGYVTIIEIERIQNQDLMMQYQARRAALENRLNRTNNIEMVLYHGTDEQTSKKVRAQGFNRRFCGRNATAYENGTYFSVSASYSAQAQYAKPDAYGTKHVFVTNVLVGDYIRGSHGMITPPPKPQNPAELFDSVVDNMNSPGIYVIFHDAQAYPEYLIKFQ
ncbi:uncharacterized protein [Asterias amurensis]|uniref:uncharacterized protein isoform X2 n=1 Tax=Asterias amurensis TaxID=7602 RepID=UPI003AB4226F